MFSCCSTAPRIDGVVVAQANPIIASMMPMVMRGMLPCVGDDTKDSTQKLVVEHEERIWRECGTEMWLAYQRARPYCISGYVPKCPKLGGDAVDGPVRVLADGPYWESDPRCSTLFEEIRALAKAQTAIDSKNAHHVAILFGSLTCPAWRMVGAQDFHSAAKEAGLPVLHVYTREAHAFDDFPAPPNSEGPIQLAPEVDPTIHRTVKDRAIAAATARMHVASQLGHPIRMVMDEMKDELEKAYEARPFRLYIIDTSTMKIAHKQHLCPFNLKAKVTAVREFNSREREASKPPEGDLS